MRPDGNYLIWSIGLPRAHEYIQGLEGVFFHHEGERETVQMRIAFRHGSTHYRPFLTRRADRRFFGPCEMTEGGRPESREVYSLEGVLCDGAGDSGLILGSGRWPVRSVGDCEWMAHLRSLRRHVVDPNALIQ